MTPETLLSHIISLDSSRFSPSGQLRLSDLRLTLPEVARGDLDSLLLSLQRAGRVVIYRFDDPLRITRADEAAALQTAGGPRHYLYVNDRF